MLPERILRPSPHGPTTKRSLEGLTLIEIMIVVFIVAMLGTAVGVAVLPQLEKARIEGTRADAQTIRANVELWKAGHPGKKCPTVQDLIDDGIQAKGKRTTDAWDTEFEIECEGNDVYVVSAGPDGEFGTDDDIE